MNTQFLAVVLFCLLFVSSQAQKFSAFKSYKDAKIKPANYGRVDKRNFEIEEYLSGNQMKMLRSRRGRDRPDEMFDNKWSGFKQYKENRSAKGAAELAVSTVQNANYNWRRLESAEENISTINNSTTNNRLFLLLCALLSFTISGAAWVFSREKKSVEEDSWAEKFHSMEIRRGVVMTV